MGCSVEASLYDILCFETAVSCIDFTLFISQKISLPTFNNFGGNFFSPLLVRFWQPHFFSSVKVLSSTGRDTWSYLTVVRTSCNRKGRLVYGPSPTAARLMLGRWSGGGYSSNSMHVIPRTGISKIRTSDE
ncbi:unnamed protein product, partial [Ectocarpus sp. 12 AP-2014]